ncbi:hypothetical protein Agub_g3446, partial [Astrephomene gubernaculifera]
AAALAPPAASTAAAATAAAATAAATLLAPATVDGALGNPRPGVGGAKPVKPSGDRVNSSSSNMAPQASGKAGYATAAEATAAAAAAATAVAGEKTMRAHIAAIRSGAVQFYKSSTSAAAASSTPPTAAAAAVEGTGKGTEKGEAVRLPYDWFRQWTKRCPALHKTLSGLLFSRVGSPDRYKQTAAAASASSATTVRPPAAATAAVPHTSGGAHTDPYSSGSSSSVVRLPVLTQLGPRLSPAATLLQPVWVWMLSSRLPPAQRREWRLLFSSQRDGKSFSTLFGRLSACPGPTLLLLRDGAGGSCGGFAPLPWVRSGSFYGDVSSFIFSLEPATQIFPATGINDNLQWCGVGFTQLPGGLGFGG